MDKMLLTPEEAAQTLSIGRSKLYELLRVGSLASVRIGGSRRIPVAALQSLRRRTRCQEPPIGGMTGG